MERAEREAIMRQGVVRPETPRDRREREALDEDLRSIPLTGKPVSLRLRNFLPRADVYLAATRGPRPYMLRLRAIETQRAHLEEALGEVWHALAGECADDDESFARRWIEVASTTSFEEVNDLIERHNRWYPIESDLAMDPRTGDYVLVGGRDYRMESLGTAWVLERFPPVLERALALSA
ncbi:MAG TPA: hypothetical protein VMN35_00980 [Gaiellaceae bacterium]|nr:hypothetical protein [Gaiellaceae bacterium]